MAEVVKPRGLTYSGTFHQWFSFGVSASRTLPTTCVHMCSVAQVSLQDSSGKEGQLSGESEILCLFIRFNRPQVEITQLQITQLQILLGCHAHGGINTNGFTIEHIVLDDVLHQSGILLGL